ncbi:hypothetical protein BDY24DRAFT_398202, partial [Mrakia frigida]|uniref:uncharacterized protein n=1 Tax=Mrakia frigida TaxID=29902 RepID=UPI003FCC17D0
MTISLPPPPPPPVESTASPLTPPKSPLPFFLTLSLLLIPYFLLSLHLGLDPRVLPDPLPSLLLVLSTFVTIYLCLPHIVVLYAPLTPKGRYGAQWTSANLNLLAFSILWLLVLGNQASWTNVDKEAPIGFSIFGAVVAFIVLNSVFGGSDDSPWNIEDNERYMLMKQARIDKLKAEADAVKAGGKGVVVEEVEVKEKEKEVELKKPDRVF